MKTLFEQITHWKTIGEWESMRKWITVTETWERYYNIVVYVKKHRAEYGYRYREKLLGSADFKQKFGYLDLEYLKKAQKTMRQIVPK